MQSTKAMTPMLRHQSAAGPSRQLPGAEHVPPDGFIARAAKMPRAVESPMRIDSILCLYGKQGAVPGVFLGRISEKPSCMGDAGPMIKPHFRNGCLAGAAVWHFALPHLH